MAKKGVREKIRLVSSAGTGTSTQLIRTSVTCQANLRSRNLIQLYASTLCTKKQKSSNWFLTLLRIEKPSFRVGFFITSSS